MGTTTGTERTDEAHRPHFSAVRTAHGISLETISKRTKIPLRRLEDLEQERFDRIPRGIYARSYVRAYASEAGIDPEVLLARLIRKLPGDESLAQVDQTIAIARAGGGRPFRLPAFLTEAPMALWMVLFPALAMIGFVTLAIVHREETHGPFGQTSAKGWISEVGSDRAGELLQPVATFGVAGPGGSDGQLSLMTVAELPTVEPAPPPAPIFRPAARTPAPVRQTQREVRTDEPEPSKAFPKIGRSFMPVFGGDNQPSRGFMRVFDSQPSSKPPRDRP